MGTHELTSAVYASGWVEGRIEDLLQAYTKAGNVEMAAVMGQMREMYETVSTTLDELIAENQALQVKLNNAQNALQ